VLDDDTQNALAQAIRTKLLEGRVTVDTFAQAVDRTPRTIFNYIAEGMPADHIGSTPMVIVEPAIAWLRNRRKQAADTS
jgi:hypothetical protein